MSNLMKIRLVGAELFHADDQEDRHIGITKLTVSFRNLANASKLYPVRKYTGCPRRNRQNFGRVFLMLNYTDITQNTYIQS